MSCMIVMSTLPPHNACNHMVYLVGVSVMFCVFAAKVLKAFDQPLEGYTSL